MCMRYATTYTLQASAYEIKIHELANIDLPILVWGDYKIYFACMQCVFSCMFAFLREKFGNPKPSVNILKVCHLLFVNSSEEVELFNNKGIWYKRKATISILYFFVI